MTGQISDIDAMYASHELLLLISEEVIELCVFNQVVKLSIFQE